MHLTKEERGKLYIAAAAAAAAGVGIAAFLIARKALQDKKTGETAANSADSAEGSARGPVIEPYEQIAPGVYGVRGPATVDLTEGMEKSSVPSTDPAEDTAARKDINLDSLVENRRPERSYTVL